MLALSRDAAVNILVLLANIIADFGAIATAARTLGFVDAYLAQEGKPPLRALTYDGLVSKLTAALSTAELRQYCSEGSGWSIEACRDDVLAELEDARAAARSYGGSYSCAAGAGEKAAARTLNYRRLRGSSP
jgi:hypothetical protein